jgi:hypothetical protein
MKWLSVIDFLPGRKARILAVLVPLLALVNETLEAAGYDPLSVDVERLGLVLSLALAIVANWLRLRREREAERHTVGPRLGG